MATVQVTDATFKKEVLESDAPVMVDFWAPWCGPCKMIAPVIDELAGEYSGKMKFVKVNVDDCQQAAAKYGIMSIPTLVFFTKGKLTSQVVGALSKADLKAKIQEHIA